MCFAHSNTIWCQDKAHLALLVGGLVQDEEGNMVHNAKKNLQQIKADLILLNKSIFVAALVSIAEGLMYHRWREDLGEVPWADKYSASWEGKAWTRAQSNQFGDGGLPSDNNGLEATNNVIKGALNRERPLLVSFVLKSLEWLEEKAMTDTSFGDKYNTHAVEQKFWAEVHESQVRDFPCLTAKTLDFPRCNSTKKIRVYAPTMLAIDAALKAGCERVLPSPPRCCLNHMLCLICAA